MRKPYAHTESLACNLGCAHGITGVQVQNQLWCAHNKPWKKLYQYVLYTKPSLTHFRSLTYFCLGWRGSGVVTKHINNIVLIEQDRKLPYRLVCVFPMNMLWVHVTFDIITPRDSSHNLKVHLNLGTQIDKSFRQSHYTCCTKCTSK